MAKKKVTAIQKKKETEETPEPIDCPTCGKPGYVPQPHPQYCAKHDFVGENCAQCGNEARA